MSAPSVSGIATRSAVVGRYAECSIAVGAGADAVCVLLFDWELNANFDFADVTAHGDSWKYKTFLDGDWTARAKGYVVPGSTNHYIKNATASSVPVSLTFKGWSGPTTSGTLLWAGPCYISRGRISAPMAMMEQEFELISNGVPTAGLG